MSKLKKNIFLIEKWSFIFIILGLIIFFEPQSFKSTSFDYLAYIDYVYKILKLFIGGIIILLYLKTAKISKNFILMSIFQTLCLLLTIVNNGDLVRFTGPAITTLVMIASAEMLIFSSKLLTASKLMVKYFRTIFLINILSIFLVDFTSLSNHMIYFLGIENRWIFTYIPWMIFEFILYFDNREKQKKTLIIYYLLMIATLFYKWSVSAMLISLIYALLFNDKFVKNYKYSIKHLISIIALNIVLVIGKIQYFFEPLIRKIGKDPTISGRTFLWDSIINGTPKKILLGHGMQSINYDKQYFFASSGKYKLEFLKVIHAHNTFMTILYRYGIISLFLYIYILYYNFKELQNKRGKYSSILFITLIVCLLLSLFDTIDCAGFYFCLGLISYIELKPNFEKTNSNFKTNILKYIKNKPYIYEILKNIYHIFYRSYCFVIGYIFRIFKIDNKKIVISNYFGKGYGDNAKYICENINKKKYKIIWLLKSENFNDGNFPPEIYKVKYNSIRGLYEMATAKFWIDNCRKMFYPPKRKQQIYIQTWHSSLRLKFIEQDATDSLTKYYIKQAKNDSKMIDLLISGCGFSTNIYKNSFWYNGKILECGTPRCDVFFNQIEKNKIKDKVYDYYNINKSKKIILYAPTFRKTSNCSEKYLDCNYINKKLEDEYVLMVRYHPLEKNDFSLDNGIINATNYYDMQELICSIEYLITDYSGCCFDAMINNTKCILFSKDKEEYLLKERKLYFDYNNLPFFCCTNEDELLNNLMNFNIKKYSNAIKKFKKTIDLKEFGKASKTLANYIMEMSDSEKI